MNAAMVAAWFAECGPEHTEIVIAANSAEQSEKRVFEDISFHFKQRGGAKVNKSEIVFDNGSRIYTISKNYGSVAGSRHALVMFDELWAARTEDDRRRWDELTPIPTIPQSLRWVTSYAGFFGESELLYDLYLRGVGQDEHPDGKGIPVAGLEHLPFWINRDLAVYWSHEPRVPWITPEYLASQLQSERPNAYLRLHENRWVTSTDTFIPLEWWEDAAKGYPQSADLWLEHPLRASPIYIAVDTAIKHDSTAICGVSQDPVNGKIGIVFHKVWTPVEGENLDLVVVKDYLVRAYQKYNVVDIACDPSQMLQVMTELRQLGLPISEFVQAETNMIEASQNLFDLMHNRNLLGYPSDEFKEHLANCIAQATSRGFRIVKDKSTKQRAFKKKIDLAIALAMAAYRAVRNMDVMAGKSIFIPSNFGDFTSVNIPDDMEAKLPFELRSN